MRKMNLLFTLLFLSASIFSQTPTDLRLKGLDTFVTKVLKDWKAPGVSIAVVEKGKVIYTGGFGFSDLVKKLPVTENTQYGIGSCTKAFTASILGMLEKDGKVDLDKPVRNYLPELKFFNEYTNDHATLRDMMCHRSGVPRHDLSWYASWATRNELLERIQYLEPTAELREKFQYNNFMFMAQGVVIEKLTGKSWEENMKEKIFRPLGMDNTNLSVKDMEKSADHSLAYATIKDSIIRLIPYRNIDAMGPAGSINSCAKDMAKWLITWINDGKYNGKEIFPSSYRNQAISIQMATGGGLPGAENPDIHINGYGLAWGIGSYRGHYRVEHGGGIDGFITSTGFYPSDSIGIFVVSNQGGPVSVIRNWIADRMLKLAYRNWNKTLLDANQKAKDAAKGVQKNDSAGRKFNTTPSHPLADYAGTYTSPGYGTIEVALKDGKLSSNFNSINVRFDHYHYDQFNAILMDPAFEDADPIRVSFFNDNSGTISKLSMQLEAGVKDIEFSREIPAIELKKEDLEKFVGEYELGPGAIAKFYIKGEKTLYAFIEGQPEYELVPTDKNKFKIKILKGYTVQFDQNEKGEVISASFIQPNGTFKAKRK